MENIPPFNAGAVAAVGGLRSQPENRRRIVGQDITAMEQNQMQFHSNGGVNEQRHFKEQPVLNGHSVSSCFKSIDIVLYNCTGYVHRYQYMYIEFVFLIYPLFSRNFLSGSSSSYESACPALDGYSSSSEVFPSL